MNTGTPSSPASNTQRYEAVLRISEALSACREPEELARVLADQLSEFLSFDHLDVMVLKEGSTEIEWHVWGKGPCLSRICQSKICRLGMCTTARNRSISLTGTAMKVFHAEAAGCRIGRGCGSIGSVVRVPLTTPHRRLGTLGIASAPGMTYSTEDIDFLRVIARVVAFAIDDGLNLRRAQQQTETASVAPESDEPNHLEPQTSRSSAGHCREHSRGHGLRCREHFAARSGTGNFQVYALGFSGRKGFVTKNRSSLETEDSPAKRAFETLKPVIATPGDAPRDSYGRKIAAAEGLKTVCFIPLVNRGRAVGNLVLARTTEGTFAQEDVEFLSQAAGPIAIAIENALAFREISELKDKLAQEKLYLEEEIRSEMNFEQIVGNSPALKQVLQLVETVAPSDSTVLLLGETGTGKELIARAIHDRSRRKDRTFVKLNCAAIPTGLLESELFGHEKGAFTGAIGQKIGRMELADQGTLFLDEVGDIPVEIQPKLLRALQEREFERLGSTHTRKVNVRLIAATNRDLEKMVANREFRSDLFYRLNVFPDSYPAPSGPPGRYSPAGELLRPEVCQANAKENRGYSCGGDEGADRLGVAGEHPRTGELHRAGGDSHARQGARRTSWGTAKSESSGTEQNMAPVQNDIARIVKETISALNGKKVLQTNMPRNSAKILCAR